MTGSNPSVLNAYANHLGIIGPIPLEEFHPDNIQKKIDQNPIKFSQGPQENSDKTPKILTITKHI